MVSILVPVYNAAPYLSQCVNSLTEQTHTDLQIVLIDDGSTDDSWSILQQLAQADRRIEVFHQVNAGVAATRNALLERARGEWVLFVDSDDWIEPTTIHTLLDHQVASGAQIEKFEMVGNHRSQSASIYNRDQVIREFLRHREFRGSLCDKLIRRDLFDGLQFDASISYGEDALMVWQVLQRVDKVEVLPNEFYHYRMNDQSISHQAFNTKKLSAYTVWNTICHDTDEHWQPYSDLAHARFAIETTKLLLAAMRSNDSHPDTIRMLQKEVRRDGHLIAKTGISTRKMSAFAWLASHCYPAARYLSRYLNNYQA